MITINDIVLQENVLAELLFEPSLDAAQITATVKNGIVTLSGSVANFPEKWAAERAVKRVLGVKGVAEELTVNFNFRPGTRYSDEDIAGAARRTLEWSANVPEKSVQIRVEDGWVTLEGTVDWQFQRQNAYTVVAHLLGVKGVSNLITLTPRVASADVRSNIEAAFKRSSDLESVQVEIEGSKITLRGTLPNWTEIDAAGLAAWNAAGVTTVNNQIHIGL
ncbi:BON domain-containing protein [Deinococcus psychrotolerans]|uniref:BON domain-containing protein n=1 Tax=Deinococcus psychrotolerans TaxID=2489213 RepID=A0A3G8YH72_9DEIO|nr:BON domain-containing protein [Deinococcus psychrotolerans]AZI44190.1 BON domain-containing protein [Deinococcus psychrotolerans]